jgi:hypothetical protein
MDYYRYVDDILIIHNAQKTNIMNTLDEFNAIHTNLNSLWNNKLRIG